MHKIYSKNTPFSYGYIDNFIDEIYMQNLKSELNDIDYIDKDNDLYSFLQSNTLYKEEGPLIEKFCEVCMLSIYL